MENTQILIVGGVLVVGFLAYQKLKPSPQTSAIQSGKDQLFDGTNWQGTMSQRLSAMDMIAPGFLNMGGSTNAHPSRTSSVGTGMGALANWQGNV